MPENRAHPGPDTRKKAFATGRVARRELLRLATRLDDITYPNPCRRREIGDDPETGSSALGPMTACMLEASETGATGAVSPVRRS